MTSLTGSSRTGHTRADLLEAVREAARRRDQNTIEGGVVVLALIEQGLSYREIEGETGVPYATAHRWAASARRA